MSIQQIPPEKFFEWIDDYRIAEIHCNNDIRCKRCKLKICEISLHEYLSIKSKEKEANQ